jgi:hypothetical protein
MAGRLWIAIAVTALAGCGHSVPFGERLLPQSYGPPFGAALKDNQPHHPHHPAPAERYAAAQESRTFRSFALCHAALEAAVRSHGEHGHVELISSVESIGSYEEGGEVHEQRCAGPVLSHRSWCKAPASGRGETHKKPSEACQSESTGH